MQPVSRDEIRLALAAVAASIETTEEDRADAIVRLLEPIFTKWSEDWVTSPNAGEGAGVWATGEVVCISTAMRAAISGEPDFTLRYSEGRWRFDVPTERELLEEADDDDDEVLSLPPIVSASLAVMRFHSPNAYRKWE